MSSTSTATDVSCRVPTTLLSVAGAERRRNYTASALPSSGTDLLFFETIKREVAVFGPIAKLSQEISDQPFRYQEKMIARVTLVGDHRIGEESALRCSSQDCPAIGRTQSNQEL
jgi:hypothetical protein